MAKLRINLLGPPEILWENERLNINRRIPRTLLYFLASQNQFIGRGKLLSIFWADTAPKNARRRLRESLSRIRAALPLNNLIVIDNDLVGLDQSKLSIDLKEFYELLDNIGNSPWVIPTDQVLPARTFHLIRSAISLWRGSQFLEGSELPNSNILDDWRYQTDLSLTQERIRLLSRISNHHLAAGQHEEALTYSRLAVESDTFNEELHYQVLRLLVELGRFQEARQYYLSTTKMLKDEFDIRPSQQFVSIYRKIQRQTQSSSVSTKTDWRFLSSIRAPFVGRDNEFNEMISAMEKGNAVLISGESGLGKTRLVQAFCDRYAPGRRVISTHCRPAEIDLPFQPIIEILRNKVSPSEWEDYPISWAEPISTFLPEILPGSTSNENPVLSVSPDHNRSTLFEAVRQVFLLLAQKGDLILFIDDLHWSDAETLSTIAYLSERVPFTENAFMVLASRSDETNQGLHNILLANRTKSNLSILNLGKLSPGEVSGLGRYVLGYPLEDELVDQLALETGGNPFIVLETLRSLQDKESLSGLIGISGQPRLPLANSVYTLVKDRLAQLSPGARGICEYAAVIGKEFDPELISAANQQSLSITARAIEELHQRHIIEPVFGPNREVTWQFVHDKIRESIILDTNRIRLQLLHLKIAQTLESTTGSQVRSLAAILARHYEYAGQLSTALGYWLLAAQWARQLFSSNEARRIFSHSERIILSSTEIIGEDIIHDFYTEWTELAYEIEDANLIREHNNRLLELGQSKQSKLLVGTALVGLSVACMVENKFDEGLDYTNQAISYLKTTGNAYEIMNSYTERGVYLYMLGRLNEAVESLEFALTFDESKDDPKMKRSLANAHYHLALCKTFAGWPELGLKNARISLEFANSIGHHHIAVTAYLASSLALYLMADYKKARLDVEAGIEIAKKLHANRMLGYLYASQAFLENVAGNIGSSYKISQELDAIGQRHNHPELQSLAHRIRGDIYILVRSYDQAQEEYQLGYELGTQDYWGLDNLVRKGFAEFNIGQSEKGMANLHRGIDLAQALGFGIVEIRGMQFLSYVHASRKEWQITRQITEKLERMARIRNLPVVGIMAKQISIIADLDQIDPEENIDKFEYLLKMIGDQDLSYVPLRILIQLIRLKNDSGVDCQREITRANRILEHCEKSAYPQEVREAFLKYKQNVERVILS